MRTQSSASKSASAHIQQMKRSADPVRLRPDRLLTIGVAISMALTICLLAALAANRVSGPIAAPLIDPDAHSGKIIVHSPQGEGCVQRHFDNATGRITDVNVPCGTSAFDDSGRPVIKGTAGRLNQIGKSFLDR
jgi:hypothetical protein